MIFLRLGCFFAFLAVCAGAFGAHALKDKLSPQDMDIFQTGVLYQMVHALALLAMGCVMLIKKGMPLWPGWLFVTGILFFSGSLYLLVLTGVRKWGMVTPIGGSLFLVGWLGFLFFLLRKSFS